MLNCSALRIPGKEFPAGWSIPSGSGIRFYPDTDLHNPGGISIVYWGRCLPKGGLEDLPLELFLLLRTGELLLTPESVTALAWGGARYQTVRRSNHNSASARNSDTSGASSTSLIHC